jgi:RNA polymerase sigma factor (TIGR02999 family)
MEDITALLRRASADDRSAIDELYAVLYADLHRMAHARLAENSPISMLDTTVLAHESYLRLRNAKRIDVESRASFMAYVSQVLRNIIVDFARRRNAERRGGRLLHVTLDTGVAESVSDADAEIEHIDEVLKELATTDPRLKQVVEMRYFGGLTDAEIAEVLNVTPRTVGRDWVRARMLLSVTLKR